MSPKLIHSMIYRIGLLVGVVGLVPLLGSVGCSSEDADASKVSAAERIETARAKLQKEDITDEERREARREMGQAFRTAMDDNVREYFAASENEKVVILDRQIDEFTERMKEWETRRAEREARRAKEAGEAGDGTAKEGEENRREGRRGRFGNSTREERKDRAESRDPDQSARRMAYFTAMRKRAQERGVDMPMGRRGGGQSGRGGGGSRGGSRGGGRGGPHG